ncbi:MAG: amidophosphoribosyltransferase [Bdellovibrionales bacterium]|nr:amidophosphoribosyltransferase [Bdellovibrionales bacterium]
MCGVVGIIGSPEASREAFLGLTTLQHRGQDAAGILSYDQDGFHRVKNIGLVEAVFNRENMATLTGPIAIGHARYATIGRGDLGDVQPFLLSYPFGVGLVHNGNIVNGADLSKQLKKDSKRTLLTQSDSEIVMNLFADALARHYRESGADDSPNEISSDRKFDLICAAITDAQKRLNGSYSIVSILGEHGLVAFRDPHGIRPLVWGSRKQKPAEALPDSWKVQHAETAHMVASESVSLAFMGYEKVRDIKPGEVLYIDLDGRVFHRELVKKEPKPCMFEWVYFASPESEVDEVPVYGTRIRLGKELGRLIKSRIENGTLGAADLVVPVPETSRIAAIALAEELGIPYREVLIKNRYIKRTFILDSQEKRQSAVNLKLSPVRSEIEGKRILLVDDSIVRGTTSKKIIQLVRNAGAKEVTFVSTCPPIRKPCYYGIDFPNPKELIASGRTDQEIEKELGANAVIYQDLEGLKASIGLSGGKTPCMACLDGKYPTDVQAAGESFAQSRNRDRGGQG